MPLTRTCFVALLLSVPPALGAQSGRIIGTTLDAQGTSISGVQVTVVGTTRSTVSTSIGEFSIDDVPVGAHVVRAARLGYQPLTVPAVVTLGQTATVTFVLTQALQQFVLISAAEPSTPLPADSLKLPVPDSAIIRKRQSAGRIAFTPRAGQQALVFLFDDLTLTLNIEQVATSGSGVQAYGSVTTETGVRTGLATIVVRGDHVIANIRVGLKLYQIRPQARGVHLIVEVDQTKLPSQSPESREKGGS